MGWYLLRRDIATNCVVVEAKFVSYPLACDCAKSLNEFAMDYEYGVSDNPMIWKINK